MIKSPFVFLILIPVVLAYSINIDLENASSYCLVNRAAVEFCGMYDDVVNYAESRWCYVAEMPDIDCRIVHPHGFEEWVTPQVQSIFTAEVDLSNLP